MVSGVRIRLVVDRKGDTCEVDHQLELGRLQK